MQKVEHVFVRFWRIKMEKKNNINLLLANHNSEQRPQALSGCFQRALELAADVLEACLIGHITSLVEKSADKRAGFPGLEISWTSCFVDTRVMYIPSWKLTCPLKRDHFKEEISTSNHQFTGDTLSFRGVIKSLPKRRLKFKQPSQKLPKLKEPSFCSFYFLYRLSREAPGFFTAMCHRFNFIKSWNGPQGGSTCLYNLWQVIQAVEGALSLSWISRSVGKVWWCNFDSWKGSGWHAVVFLFVEKYIMFFTNGKWG